MSNSAECSECRAILEEFKKSAAERVERVVSSERREELRAYAEGVRGMIAGSEDSTDELLAKYPFRPHVGPVGMPSYPPKLSALAAKIVKHQVRTGHKIFDLFRK